MRIIVAGIGEVGHHLASMLSSSYHDIVAIDPEADSLEELAAEADLVTVMGSATSVSVLKQAEVSKADLFIAVASSEGTNIMSAVLAKQLGAQRVIARIDNNEYLQPANVSLFHRMGVDQLIYPEKLASQVIIRLLGDTSSMEYIDFAKGRLGLSVIRIDEGMPYVGLTLAAMSRALNGDEPLDSYLVVAIARNGETIIPTGEEKVQAGDALHIIANGRGTELWRKLRGGDDTEVKNLMVLGASRMGVRTCLDLEDKIRNIKLIEADAAKCQRVAPLCKKTLVINGDGRDMDKLLEEEVGKMDAFVAVTGSSETNILACMAARRAGVKQIIAEVENLDYIALAESVGVDAVVNKKLITASSIFRHTMGSNISSMHCMTGSEAEVLEFVAKDGSKATRGRLKDLNFPKKALVGGIIRGDQAFIATGKTEILPGDRVVVFALNQAVNKLSQFFR